MPLTEDELVMSLGSIKANIRKNSKYFDKYFGLNRRVEERCCAEGIFSETEWDVIRAEPGELNRGRACLQALLAKEESLEEFVKILKEAEEYEHLMPLFEGSSLTKQLQREERYEKAIDPHGLRLFEMIAPWMEAGLDLFLQELEEHGVIKVDEEWRALLRELPTDLARADEIYEKARVLFNLEKLVDYALKKVEPRTEDQEFLAAIKASVLPPLDLPPRANRSSKVIVANIIKSFSEIVSHLDFDGRIKYCIKGVFSRAALERIKAESDKFGRNRVCLLVLLDKAKSEQDIKGEAGQFTGAPEDFVEALKRAGCLELASFLERCQGGELYKPRRTDCWTEKRYRNFGLVDRRRVIEEEDVPLLKEFLREVKAAAKNREEVIQEKNAGLKEIWQRVHLAQEGLKQAEQVAAFWEEEFPEVEQLAHLEEAVQSKKARLEESLTASEAEKLEKAGQAVAFLLREKVSTKAELVVVVREKKEALDTVEQEGKAWEVLYQKREASADERVSKSEEPFWGIDRGLLFDCCNAIKGKRFPEDFEALRRCKPCEPLGPVLAGIIDVENTEAMHGLYMAFRKSGYVEAVREGREDRERRGRRDAGRKKFMQKRSCLVNSVNLNNSLLRTVHLAGLISPFDRVSIPRPRPRYDCYERVRALLDAMTRNDDILERFGPCLQRERQELPYKHILCSNYTDVRAERFNKNWAIKRALIHDVVRDRERLNPAFRHKILDEFARSGIITAGWADELKEKYAEKGGDLDRRLPSSLEFANTLEHMFNRFTFDQICEGWYIVNKGFHKLGRLLVNDDIRQYQAQARQHVFRLAYIAGVVVDNRRDLETNRRRGTKELWPLDRSSFESLISKLSLLTLGGLPPRQKIERCADYCLALQSRFFHLQKVSEPVQVEEFSEESEEEWVCLNEMSVN